MKIVSITLTAGALAVAALSTHAIAQTAAQAGQTPLPQAAATARALSQVAYSPSATAGSMSSAPSSPALDLTPRTAIDHRFGPDELVGSIGYLCGLQPQPGDTHGAASTFGPVGTFLGAKLSYGFK